MIDHRLIETIWKARDKFGALLGSRWGEFEALIKEISEALERSPGSLQTIQLMDLLIDRLLNSEAAELIRKIIRAEKSDSERHSRSRAGTPRTHDYSSKSASEIEPSHSYVNFSFFDVSFGSPRLLPINRSINQLNGL